jgi:putative FmdB family regulatory protein
VEIAVFLLLFLRSCAASKTQMHEMPIYEYRCDDCGHEFETIQKISEDPLKECPACQQSALVKKISAAGFRLKGGGWYETDFKSGNKRNLSGSSESSKNGESSGESKGSSDSNSSSSSGSESGSKGSGDSKSTKSSETSS